MSCPTAIRWRDTAVEIWFNHNSNALLKSQRRREQTLCMPSRRPVNKSKKFHSDFHKVFASAPFAMVRISFRSSFKCTCLSRSLGSAAQRNVSSISRNQQTCKYGMCFGFKLQTVVSSHDDDDVDRKCKLYNFDANVHSNTYWLPQHSQILSLSVFRTEIVRKRISLWFERPADLGVRSKAEIIRLRRRMSPFVCSVFVGVPNPTSPQPLSHLNRQLI